MNMITTLLLCFLLCFPFINTDNTNMPPPIEKKIVRERFARIWEAPFLAGLESQRRFICSACVLSKFWLGTRVDCFVEITNVHVEVQARVGSSYMLTGGVTHSLAEFRPHPNYTSSNIHINNIALLRTASIMKFNRFVKNIPLRSVAPSVRQSITLFSWGLVIAKGKTAYVQIKKVILKVISSVMCNNILKKNTDIRNFNIYSTQFCTNATSAGPCRVDSGGPGVIHGQLAGIMSVINANTNSFICNSAILLTRISTFIPWIKLITNIP